MIEANTDLVQVSAENGILQIQLNRPERKNALSLAMYKKLGDSIRAGSEDPSVRVILIHGAGGSFTSGNDLGDFARHKGQLDPEENPTPKFMRALLDCDKPVVAAVQGPAVGIGTTMLLHCDLVYADNSAYFQLPFAKLGLCPEFASSVVLPRLMGHARAAELLYFSESFSADVAREVGIVNQVFSGEELLPTVLERCATLSRQPASGLRATKRLLKKDIRESAEAIMQREQEFFRQGLQSPEFAEAVAAFGEKREPDFSKFS
ncbi:enoyl-CoA hydratase [Gilvimarinus sp. F26214L]|uniref:enoyl-CoA hydratase n=1 Tax=Gilvimarinus sp. DZF01 TaxID=3461371 RepID=UPI0040462856